LGSFCCSFIFFFSFLRSQALYLNDGSFEGCQGNLGCLGEICCPTRALLGLIREDFSSTTVTTVTTITIEL